MNVTGGYDPTQTDETSSLIRSMEGVYRAERVPYSKTPRLAGSWLGYIFTGAPVNLPAGHFGLGHGGRQHAPDEYLVIEPENPNLRGFDAATLAYVELLYGLSQT